MKFLVITDLHQKLSSLQWINDEIHKRKPDCVLLLGDVTDFGTSEDARNIISAIDSEVFVIPGNCDPLDLPQSVGDIAHDMHGRSATVGGIYIAGCGGSNPTIFDTPFELSENDLYGMLLPISKQGMVLMTHAPSYGMLDEIPSGAHVGSTGIKRIVEEFRPMVAVSGHIHEAIGAKTVDGTLFVNPGPAKEGRFALVTIEDGKATAQLFGPLDV